MTTEPSSSPSREPDFGNLLKVLNRQCPDRPTLFEFFLNEPLYQKLAGGPVATAANRLEQYQNTIRAFRNVGYDYATVRGSDFSFPQGDRQHASSISANEGALIHDRASFQAYPWPDPAAFDYSILATIAPHLPNGMKLIVMGPGGVLENVMALVGYDATCYMIMDDPKLATEIFAAIGERLVRHYELAARHGVGGYHHCCGAIFEIIPMMIDAGVQVLNPIQTSAKGMSPVELKKEFGKDSNRNNNRNLIRQPWL